MMPPANPQKSASSPAVDAAFRQGVNRFVSTLAAAFRAFHLYHQDNRAFDEIMQNLSRRFQETVPPSRSVKLSITNRSFVFEGQPTGYKDITVYLTSQLRSLGYKEILFQPPIQSRNFFQLLHVLSSKESDEIKNDRLVPLLSDGESKPISLVPITANSTVMRLSDQLITLRLTPLSIPEDLGGNGFMDKLSDSRFNSLADLYNWICMKVDIFPPALKVFARNLTDAAREGYFPFDRFLRLFPLPRKLREDLKRRTEPLEDNRPRKPTPLGHRFARVGKRMGPLRQDWMTHMVIFSETESKALQSHRVGGESTSAAQDLDMAQSLLKEQGSNFILGLCFLMRYMAENNPIAIQEKALKIAVDIWTEYQSNSENLSLISLLSSLRQGLTAPHNIILSLYPIRNSTMDSPEFKTTINYLLSLGKAVMPGLIHALEAEQDRGMRKKLCELITLVAKEFGVEALVAAVPKSSPFLLRNLVMILGDIRHPLTVSDIAPLLRHDQKMVRIEAMRTLCKIGNEDAMRLLLSTLEQTQEQEIRQGILEFFLHAKYTTALDAMIRLARQPSSAGPWRRTLYNAIAALGGTQTKPFFEQLQRDSGFITRFNPEQKEDTELIKNLLSKMTS